MCTVGHTFLFQIMTKIDGNYFMRITNNEHTIRFSNLTHEDIHTNQLNYSTSISWHFLKLTQWTTNMRQLRKQLFHPPVIASFYTLPDFTSASKLRHELQYPWIHTTDAVSMPFLVQYLRCRFLNSSSVSPSKVLARFYKWFNNSQI